MVVTVLREGKDKWKGTLQVKSVGVSGGREVINFDGGYVIVATEDCYGLIKKGDKLSIVRYDSDTFDVEIDVNGQVNGQHKEQMKMIGKIYNGWVVKTRTIPSAEGTVASKDISEIVFTAVPFVAADDAQASAVVVAAATKADKADFASVTDKFEAVIQKVN